MRKLKGRDRSSMGKSRRDHRLITIAMMALFPIKKWPGRREDGKFSSRLSVFPAIIIIGIID